MKSIKEDGDIKDWLEDEVMKILAIADVLSVISVCDIEKNTLAVLSCIITETTKGIYESVRELL